MYCSYSQYSQYLGHQYCSYSKYSEYLGRQYSNTVNTREYEKYSILRVYSVLRVYSGVSSILGASVQGIFHVFTHIECCYRGRCYCCSVVILLLLLQLLLFVIVCRMAKIVAFSLNVIPSLVFFSSFSNMTFSVCTPWQCYRIHGLRLPYYTYILGNYGYARSQGGRQPAAAKSPVVFSFSKIIQNVHPGPFLLNISVDYCVCN